MKLKVIEIQQNDGQAIENIINAWLEEKDFSKIEINIVEYTAPRLGARAYILYEMCSEPSEGEGKEVDETDESEVMEVE